MEPTRILITGSNSGFGRLAALTLAKQGHHVIATMRNLAKGDDLLAAAEGLGGRVERRALHPAAPTLPSGADRLMHSTRSQGAYEPHCEVETAGLHV